MLGKKATPMNSDIYNVGPRGGARSCRLYFNCNYTKSDFIYIPH